MPTLLERDGELRQLRHALGAAREGCGGLLIVEGAAGLGKSALLEAATQDAERQRMCVLFARSGPQDHDVSFGVPLGLFDGELARDGRAREELLAGAAALCLPVFDGAQWHAARSPERGSLDGLLHGLLWLTVNLSARAPLLLAVDDVHWSDAASLRFLLYLAPRLAELPIAVMLTRRPGEPDEHALARELAEHPLAQRIELASLSSGAVTSLLEDGLGTKASAPFAAACAEASGGNPFLIRAIVQALRDDQIAPTAENAGTIDALRPEVVRRQLLVRISRLGGDAAAIASVAAVLGDGARIETAAELAEIEPDTAARAADALVAAEILASAVPLAFAHPLLRASLYDDLPAAQRARAHVRAARRLRDEHAASETIATQLLGATRVGEEWAFHTLQDAAQRALASGNPESAAHYLARALEEPLTGRDRAGALLALAGAEAMLGQAAAESHIEEAIALSDDPEALARAYQRLGGIRYTRGDLPGAARAFERGIALAGEPGSPLARELHAGFFSAASLDPELAALAFAHIEPLLEREPGSETKAERAALAALASHRALGGAPREQAAALARRAWGDGALLREEGPDGWAWSLVTAAFTCTDELEETLAVCEAVIARAQEEGSLMAYATASFCAQPATLQLARFDEARAHGEAASAARQYGWRTYEVTSAGWMASTLIEQDQLDAAERVLAEMEDRLDVQDARSAPALAIRGRLRLLRGSAAEALADLRAAGELATAIMCVNEGFVPWRSDAALAAHRLGDVDQAEELVAEARAIATTTGASSHLARALRSKAALRGGEQAVELLRESLAALEGCQPELQRLYCLYELGAALRRQGKRSEARAVLSEALERAHRSGARRVERLAHEELRVAGARPRRLMFSGPDALTPSERRVAGMAIEGASNREIAEALFVTPRTVEQHLYNSYKKLGIQSRTELAGALREG